MKLAEKEKELADLQAETIKVIRGESRLNVDLLNELVDKANAEMQELQKAMNSIQQEIDEHLTSLSIEKKEYDKIKTWADLYPSCQCLRVRETQRENSFFVRFGIFKTATICCDFC